MPSSTQEMLPLVSELDREIGRIERTVAHEQRAMHRSVHVLLTRTGGELVLQRRALDRAVAPGLLDSSAAGHVAAGESYLDCARRETVEELGVGGRRFRPLMLLPAEAATGNEFCLVMHLVHDGELSPCPREILALESIGQDQLLQRMSDTPDDFAPTLRRIVFQLAQEGRWPLVSPAV